MTGYFQRLWPWQKNCAILNLIPEATGEKKKGWKKRGGGSFCGQVLSRVWNRLNVELYFEAWKKSSNSLTQYLMFKLLLGGLKSRLDRKREKKTSKWCYSSASLFFRSKTNPCSYLAFFSFPYRIPLPNPYLFLLPKFFSSGICCILHHLSPNMYSTHTLVPNKLFLLL